MVGRRSHHGSFTQAKKDLKKEKIRSANNAWKGKGIAPEPNKGDLQRPIWTPSCKGQHVDAQWVMAYDHKTQSFMKNRDQQKCLDKALIHIYILRNSWSKRLSFDKVKVSYLRAIFSHNIMKIVTVKLQCNSIQNERWCQIGLVFHVTLFDVHPQWNHHLQLFNWCLVQIALQDIN